MTVEDSLCLPLLGRGRRGRVDKLVAVRGHPRDLAPVPLGLGRRLLVLLGVVEPQAEAQRVVVDV